MSGMSISCLGAFVLKVDEQKIGLEQWKSKKAITLLQYLIAMEGQKASLESIVEVLWPDSTVDMSTDNLYTTIYNLRQTLDSTKKRAYNWIRNSNRFYWLDLSEISFLDTIEFKRNINIGEQLESSNPLQALVAFQQAIELYRGRFLSELDDESWVITQRNYYQNKFLDAVLKASDILVNHKQDYQQAITLLREAIIKEPFQERLYRELIDCLLETGASGEVVSEYENYSKMLDENFGMAPDEKVWQRIYNARLSPEIDGTTSESGAFQCDPETLRKIIDLEQRRMGRTKRQVFLVTIYTGSNLTAKVTQLALNLFRSSDIICRYPDRLQILLTIDPGIQVQSVINRLESTLLAKLNNTLPIEYHSISKKEKKPQIV